MSTSFPKGQNAEEAQNSIVTLHKKLAALRAEIGTLSKKSSNPFFKSKYLDLNALLDAVDPLLVKHDLALIQPVIASQIGNIVETEIVDISSGASVKSNLALPALNDMQKLGGAVTYARRYTLQSLLGVKAIDDDGNFASGKTKKLESNKF